MPESDLEKLLNLVDSPNPILRNEASKAIVHSVCVTCKFSLSMVVHAIINSNSRTELRYQNSAKDVVKEMFYTMLNALPTPTKLDPESDVTDISDFNLQQLISSHNLLYADKNIAFDESTTANANGSKDQRKKIEQSLGMDNLSSGIDSKALFSDEDLSQNSTGAPDSKRIKLEPELDLSQLSRLNSLMHSLSTFNYETDPQQVLQITLEILKIQLLDSKWGIRLMSANLLGSLATLDPKLISMTSTVTPLFTCLALDRFNDYSGPCTHAPVRSACASGLANIFMTSQLNTNILEIMEQFLHSIDWELQLSALLVLRSIFDTVKHHGNIDTKPQLMNRFYCTLVAMLNSEHDDISTISTLTLDSIFDGEINNKLVVKSEESSYDLMNSCWSLLTKLGLCGDEGSAVAVLQLLKRNLHGLESQLQFVHADLLIQIVESHGYGTVRKSAFECMVYLWKSNAIAYDNWPSRLLGNLLDSLFNRCLVDPKDSPLPSLIISEMNNLIIFIGMENFVDIACNNVGAWLAYMMVPDSAPFLDPKSLNPECSGQKTQLHLGGVEVMSLGEDERAECTRIIKFRLAQFCAPVFEAISGCCKPRLEDQSPSESLQLLIQLHIGSNSYLQKTVTLACLIEWAKQRGGQPRLPSEITELLTDCLIATLPVFDESIRNISELHCVADDFLKFCGLSEPIVKNIGPRDMKCICEKAYESALLNRDPIQRTELEAKWRNVQKQISSLAAIVTCMSRHYKAYLSVCCISWNILPVKVSPIIQPLIECVKDDKSNVIMTLIANAFPKLLASCQMRNPCPTPKILNNLVTLYCTEFIPMENVMENFVVSVHVESNVFRDIPVVICNAEKVLQSVVKTYKNEIGGKISVIWDYINKIEENSSEEDIICSLRVLYCVGNFLCDENLRDVLARKSKILVHFLAHESPNIRYKTCCCLSSLAECNFMEIMNVCLPWCIEKLKLIDNLLARLGIMEFWTMLVENMKERMVGSCTLLAPSVLSRMSDCDPTIRLLASKLFPNLVQFLPLESGKYNQSGCLAMSMELKRIRNENEEFLALLTHPSKLQACITSIPNVSVELRPYQKEGITWMTFLGKFSLHGILADEMGLGKTLQTLCTVAASYIEEMKQGNKKSLKSLIICPRTLVSHWVEEVHKYFGDGQDFRIKG